MKARPRGRDVIRSLVERHVGLPVLPMIDGSAGLAAALHEQWPTLAIQRCTTHKLRNLEAKAPVRLREELAEDYRRMVYAESRTAVEQARARFTRKWRLRCPAVVECLEEAGDTEQPRQVERAFVTSGDLRPQRNQRRQPAPAVVLRIEIFPLSGHGDDDICSHEADIQRPSGPITPQRLEIDRALGKTECHFHHVPIGKVQRGVEVPCEQVARARLQVAICLVVAEQRSRDRRAR